MFRSRMPGNMHSWNATASYALEVSVLLTYQTFPLSSAIFR
jgi:hypothetical protein